MTPEEAVARRLRANHLAERLPAGSFVEAARSVCRTPLLATR